MEKRGLCWSIGAMLVLATAVKAEDLVKESLASLPPETIRMEYSSPAKLRRLPNYVSLRQRYVGPQLRILEERFAELGVRESDIDEVVLGWQGGGEQMELEGLVTGRFSPKDIADRAEARGLSPSTVGEVPAYCLGPETGSTCVVVVSDALGAFGPLSALGTMMAARDGQAPSLASNERFVKLVGEARGPAPIWGVAVGNSVADWFKAYLPSQGNLQLDWARAFQSVEALAYSVETAEKVRLEAKMDCATPEAAQSMRQVFEGLKLFQQLAWQNQYPNRPNPFESVEIGLEGRRVLLKLTTGYSELESAPALGTPSN